MRCSGTWWAAVGATVAMLGAGGCGDDEVVGTADGGADAGDVAGAEAGRPRALCPAFANPSCSTQAACVDQSITGFRTVSDCDFCPEFSPSVCTFGECELREDLQNEQALAVPGARVSVPTGDLQAGEIDVFVGVAVQAEAAGGALAECADVRDGTFDFRNACANVVDVRKFDNAGGGPTFRITFSDFPADRETLFLVYAFDNDGATGEPLGSACARSFIPLPDGALVDVASEPMQRFE